MNRNEQDLPSVGIRASVGHGKHTRSSVFQGEVLVGKFRSVD